MPAGKRLRSSAGEAGGGSAISSRARGRDRMRSCTSGSTGAVGRPNLPST